jgi:hypothetical protein
MKDSTFFSPSKVIEANCIRHSSTSADFDSAYFKSQSFAIAIPFNKKILTTFL